MGEIYEIHHICVHAKDIDEKYGVTFDKIKQHLENKQKG